MRDDNEERSVGALTVSQIGNDVKLPVLDLKTRIGETEQDIPYLLDTGSEQCVIGENHLKMFGHVEIKPSKVRLVGVNGMKIKQIGRSKVTIFNEENVYRTEACVVKKLDFAILDFRGLRDLRILPDGWCENVITSQLERGEEDDSEKKMIRVGDEVKVKMGRPREKWSEVLRGTVMKIEERINKVLIKLESGAYYWRH